MNQIDGVVDVKDLLAELVRKCWLVIVMALICAVSLGGYKYIQLKQEAELVNEENVIGQELTDEDKEKAKDYVAAVQAYESAVDYCDNSILITIDPYNVYQTELQYVISGDFKEDDVATIRSIYLNYISYGRLQKDVEAYTEFDAKYLTEIMRVVTSNSGLEENVRSFSIVFNTKDLEQTETLKTAIQTAMSEYSASKMQEVGSHKLDLVDSTTIQIVRTDLVGLKDSRRAYRDTCKTMMETLEANLSLTQKSYAHELLERVIEEENSETTSEGVQDETLKEVLKFLVLGGAAGFAVAVVLIVAFYFFTNQIKSEKELAHIYEISHLANVCVYRRNIFDKIADKIFYKEKIVDVKKNETAVLEKITSFCKERNITSLYLVGKVDGAVQAILENICTVLRKENINVCVMETVLEGFEKDESTFSKNIILLERIRKTNMFETKNEIEFCKEHNLMICGYVTFSK